MEGRLHQRRSLDFKWVPDSQADNCHACRAAFTLFRRKHHCRFCGRVFCHACSSMRIDVSEKGSAHPETYRACMACYQRDRTSGAERSEVDVVGENAILYHTRTLCVPCSITERRGYDPVPAIVVQRGDTVYLERNCPVHGLLSTEYCRSATFFREAITFAAGVPGDPFDADLDALASEIKSNRSSLPLVVELHVTTGSGQLLSTSLVDMRLRKIENLFPSELSFILDIKGGALSSFSHVAQLNTLLLHIEQVTRRCLIIVDLAYDRLIDFAHIPNSALLKGRIFPGVRYHLVRGEEETAVAELTQLITTMRDFSRIQLIFTLSFDRPFPSLASALGLVRQHRDIIKFVVLSPERSTRELLATASKSHMTYDAAGGSVDPVELIDLVCQDVGYGLTRSDFIPASVLQCLEPLLSLMGYGQYSMRISSLCGFICPLQFGTGSSITPVARIIDSRRLLKTVSSLSDALRPRTIPVLALNRLRNELLSCTLSGTIMQDILTSLASIDSGESSSAHQRLAEFVSSLQFIIVDVFRTGTLRAATPAANGLRLEQNGYRQHGPSPPCSMPSGDLMRHGLHAGLRCVLLRRLFSTGQNCCCCCAAHPLGLVVVS